MSVRRFNARPSTDYSTASPYSFDHSDPGGQELKFYLCDTFVELPVLMNTGDQAYVISNTTFWIAIDTVTWGLIGPGSGSALTVQEEDGSPIDTAVATLRFPNGSVTVNAAGDVSVAFPTSSGHEIRENGVAQTTRAGLNFVDVDAGAGLITDDAGGDETEVNLGLYVLEAATPGGELGGTYAVPTVDAVHSGSSHAATQAAAEATAAAALAGHTGDTSDAHDASAVSVDSTTLVGVGTDVQAVLEELDDGIADHLADAVDAHDASAVSNVPAGSVAATTVQAAIDEIASEYAAADAAHLADATDAHDASAISIVDAGGYITGTDVETAIQELGLRPSGHTIHDQDSAALIQRAAIRFHGKGVMGMDNSSDATTDVVSGLYYDAIVDDTDHHGMDRSRSVSVSSITRSGSTATVTTSAAHGFIDGQSVTIAGANEAEYNGVFVITSHATPTTFTYEVTGAPATPATGTITATVKAAVYSTLQAAITDKKVSIFVHSAGDTSDITIASTDFVARILGEASLLSAIPVNVTCAKVGVSFEFLLFSSKRLKFTAARCLALGCVFTGTITPGTGALNDGTGINTTDLSIVWDGGANGGLPSGGYAVIDNEPFGYRSGGGASSGTLVVGTTARRGQFDTAGFDHADNAVITDLTDGHLIVEADDCTALTCQFISCIGPYTHCIIQRTGKNRMRVVSSTFLSNTTWSCIAWAPANDSSSDYGRNSVSACVFDTNTNTNALIDTFQPNTATNTHRACALAISINGCLFRDFPGIAIRQYGLIWNISGNVFESTTLMNRTFQINLGGGITAVQTTVPYDTQVGSVSPAPRGFMKIDSEIISYIQSATPLTSCGRGLAGTTAATHADNAVITVMGQIAVLIVPGPSSISGASLVAGCLFQTCMNPLFTYELDWTGNIGIMPSVAIETSGINGGTLTLGPNYSLFMNNASHAIDCRSRTGISIIGKTGSSTISNLGTDTFLFTGKGTVIGLPYGNIFNSGVGLGLGRIAGDTSTIGLPATNRTGATSVVGNVVIHDAANANSVVNAGIIAVSNVVAGVVVNAVANLADLSYAVEGIVTVNCDTGAVAINDRLGTSLITAGLAATNAAPLFNTYFAIAKTAKAAGANGSVKAVLRLQ
jgi:hypothetical protein